MNTIFSLGFIFLVGLIAARLINKIKLPSVTAYLLLGIILGPSLGGIISRELLSISGFVSNIALGIIAFSLGQNFTRDFFRRIGRSAIVISIFETALTWILVTFAVFFITGQPFYVALILGAISSATAPAATAMVVREYKSRGKFTDTLLGVVAIDDAWCLIIFAFSLAVAKAVAFHVPNGFMLKMVFHALMEIIGAFLLGGLTAYLISLIAKYILTPTELLIYTLGFILLTTGIALKLHFSVLLANMFLGAVLINIRSTNFRFFEVLRSIDSPLYLLFFCLAGANLDFGLIRSISLMGLVYLFCRAAGKMIGPILGGRVAKADQKIINYLGLGLLPQAGVALGCALIVKSDFPQVGGVIFTTIVATTVIYELIGPVCTKVALEKSGDINPSGQPS
ncbi:MAG: cation:proton antiporter [Candidatus Omnitrophota bacterium]